jgi:hypothetical protein
MKLSTTITGLMMCLMLLTTVNAVSLNKASQNAQDGTPEQAKGCGFWDRLIGNCQKEQPQQNTQEPVIENSTQWNCSDDACCKAKNENFVWSTEVGRCINQHLTEKQNCGFWARLFGTC